MEAAVLSSVSLVGLFESGRLPPARRRRPAGSPCPGCRRRRRTQRRAPGPAKTCPIRTVRSATKLRRRQPVAAVSATRSTTSRARAVTTYPSRGSGRAMSRSRFAERANLPRTEMLSASLGIRRPRREDAQMLRPTAARTWEPSRRLSSKGRLPSGPAQTSEPSGLDRRVVPVEDPGGDGCGITRPGELHGAGRRGEAERVLTVSAPA